MTTETQTFQIYYALIEKRGEKTDALINEIIELSKRFNVYEEVSLIGAFPTITAGPNDNKLVYNIEIQSANTDKGAEIVAFLTHIFEKMFDKFPAFTEPDFQ